MWLTQQVFDAHLDGRARAHPDDTAWDGASFTHRWYNTGRACPHLLDNRISASGI